MKPITKFIFIALAGLAFWLWYEVRQYGYERYVRKHPMGKVR